MMGTASRRAALPLLLLACVAPATGLAPTGRSWREVTDVLGSATMVSTLMTHMNDLLLFPSGAIATNILSAAVSDYAEQKPRYLFTLDVNQGGVDSVVQVEAYQVKDKWHPILTVASKNAKITSPESLTSPIDVWTYWPTNDPLVIEATPKVDALLQASAFSGTGTGRPELVSVIHAERRRRDVGLEFQYVKETAEKNQAQMLETTRLLAERRAEVTTALAAKAKALEDGDSADSPTVVLLTDQITDLNKKIVLLEEKEKLAPTLQLTLTDSVKLLQSEINTIQAEAVSGTTVANSRTYLLLILQYQVTQNFVAVPFRKQVVAYKDSGGNWKLVSTEDFQL